MKRALGEILKIPLGEGTHAYAQVSTHPLMLFFDWLSEEAFSISDIVNLPIAFKVFVMDSASKGRSWKSVGIGEKSEDRLKVPIMFTQDPISGHIFLHHGDWAPTNYERPASLKDIEGMERAAVWSAIHIEDRLRDHFAGLPNKWVQSMKVDLSRLPHNQR